MVAVVVGLAVVFLFVNSAVYARSYGDYLCQSNSKLICYIVKKGDTWEKLFVDPAERDVIMRLNRVNIRLYPGMRIAVPTYSFSDRMRFAPFHSQIEAPGKKVIIVSLPELAWGAYNQYGTLENWGPVSGGRGYCPDINRGCNTPAGHFSIYTKQGARCVSTKFPVGVGGAPMPYCMFFKGGFALHGSYEVPGYNASHGCVRLFVNDAKWLNEDFTAGEDPVSVIIYRKSE